MSILIVGLGNPGEKHQSNRHNLGFHILDALVGAWQLPPYQEQASLHGLLTAKITEPKAWVLKPTTFMNDSGRAVMHTSRFYHIEPGNLWVVHDDMDIPFGSLKIHRNISAGGHNGVASIIEQLHTQDFWRVRIGISRPRPLDANADGRVDPREWAIAKYDVADYVLANWDPEQQSGLPAVIERAVAALTLALAKGPEAAANQYNSAQ
ncbi:MAG: aminoacyl-tRNA hydrolase [Patescibacteria group bacterium]